MRRILILLVILLLAASVVMAQDVEVGSAPDTPSQSGFALASEPASQPEPESKPEPESVAAPAPELTSEQAAEQASEQNASEQNASEQNESEQNESEQNESEQPESQRHALLQAIDSKGGIPFHKDMFIAPFSYNERFTGRETETVFQLSFKARILGGPLYFGYTQRSFWQAYDSEESAPFRETNYNPEVFARFQPGNWLSSQWGFDVGIEHESNGKRVPESRSWNKVYGAMFHEGEDDVIWLKAWYRLPEDKKEDSLSAEGDDNPDIDDYYGDAELRYRRCLDGYICRHLFTGLVRGNLETGRGAVELSWSFPTGSEQTSWYVYLFSGFGESLIDYNNAENRIAIGVTLRPQ